MQDKNNPTQTKASNPKDVLAASESRVQMGLIPRTALIHTAMAFADGAKKYGAYNWREEGVGVMTYLDAADRHIADFLDGETAAGDSKAHHLGHAIACLAIILDAFAVGNVVDNRPPIAPTADFMEQVKSGSTCPERKEETDGKRVTHQRDTLVGDCGYPGCRSRVCYPHNPGGDGEL